MKIIKPMWRGFCLVSGLLMAPILLALGLSATMGVLPPLERIRAALLDPQSANAETDAKSGTTKASELAPDDAHYWERRMSSVGSNIERDRDEADQRLAEAKVLESKLTKIEGALEKLLEAALGREFEREKLADEADTISNEIVQMTSEESRFPLVLETATTMSPKALASILLPRPGAAAGEPLTKTQKQTVKLLRGLKPRTTGKVLEAMAKTNPAYARELIESMGGAAESGLR